MTPEPIVRGDDRWETLMRIWIGERKPGFITDRTGAMYKVIPATDEDIQFHPQGAGIDGMYSTRSTKSIAPN